MKIYKVICTFLFLFILQNVNLFSQELTQTIRGKVVDIDSKAPLQRARVIISNTKYGALTEQDGSFKISGVPVGRYNIQATYIGYNIAVKPEVLVNSGKEVFLTIEMKESFVQTEEVIVTPTIEKAQALNLMGIVSARSFSVEETRRYAGAVDDPLRAVSSFAGVVGNADLGNNEIVIRGNSPKGILWRLDDIDIPNPNHYGLAGQSGGGMTIFSSQMLTNSDFFTAAFPAEYGNALSGVFDMKFRNGNNSKREYTFQLGALGIDLSAEGPFSEGSSASYLFNYRYSTLGLLSHLIPNFMAGALDYQDLSFKINIPTKKLGTFSIMSISGLASQDMEPEKDSTVWKTYMDREKAKIKTTIGVISLSHSYVLDNNTFIKTSLAATGHGINFSDGYLMHDYELHKTEESKFSNSKMELNFYINHKFNARHTNKTGIIFNSMFFNIDSKGEDYFTGEYMQFIKNKGNTNLLQFYSQSKYDLLENLSLEAGLHCQYFALNSHYSIEPRAALKWKFTPFQAISIGYGAHSQLENIGIYLASNYDSTNKKIMPNHNLDFSKAHHFVISYDYSLTSDLRLKIEPYYQQLYNIPVVNNSYYSLINFTNGYFNDSLVNKGTGQNAGIDFTLEKFLNEGYYFLITASLFSSKYKGGDGVERNTRFNNHFVVNALYGVEYRIRETNILGLNIKATFSGGEYYNPIDLEQSIAQNREVLDYSKAYENKLPDFYYIDFTLTYRNNYQGWSGIFALQIKNLLNQKIWTGYRYNAFTQSLNKDYTLGFIPAVSYKVEF